MIDGYPRNQDNINGWIEVFGDQCKILCVLYLSCEEDICVTRILERSKTSGRSDDDKEIIKKRFGTFYKESMPILIELSKMTKVIEIPSIKSPEEVFGDVQKELDVILSGSN